jgi:hypothetical protein
MAWWSVLGPRRDDAHAARSVSQRFAAIRCNVALSAGTAVAATIWVVTAPQSPQHPTIDEVSQFIALGFLP